MGGLSRQFLNLILDNRINGVRSLRCIDITRQHFFNITKPVASGQQKNKKEQAASKMGKIRLPTPSLSIRGSTSKAVFWRRDARPLCPANRSSAAHGPTLNIFTI
ncbi:unnamed protein product [Urochloa humidicola]